MSVPPTFSFAPIFSNPYTGKRKHDSQETQDLRPQPIESEKPLFSSTAPGRLESLKKVGSRLTSEVSSAIKNIRSGWTSALPIPPLSGPAEKSSSPASYLPKSSLYSSLVSSVPNATSVPMKSRQQPLNIAEAPSKKMESFEGNPQSESASLPYTFSENPISEETSSHSSLTIPKPVKEESSQSSLTVVETKPVSEKVNPSETDSHASWLSLPPSETPPSKKPSLYLSLLSAKPAQRQKFQQTLKADPFEKDSQGQSALERATFSNDLPSLKDLTGTTSHQAFASCKDIHDFFEVLFPAFREELPPKWKEFVKKNPKSAELVEFERRIIQEFPNHPNKRILPEEEEFNTFRSSKPDKNSLEALAEFLTEKSFPFKQAWELANRHQQVTLLELPEESSISKEYRIHAKGTEAYYKNADHSISIAKEAKFPIKFGYLIFETINALQKSSLENLERQCTGREEHACTSELIEMNSYTWRRWMLGRADDFKLPDERKQELWKIFNTVTLGPGFISHTDHHRRQWDRLLSIRYLESNPDFLQTRLEELAADVRKEPTELKIQSGAED